MTRTEPFFRAALSVALLAFAGTAMAAEPQSDKLAQATQPAQPGIETSPGAPPGGYQPEREGGVPPYPDGIGRTEPAPDQPAFLQLQEGMDVVDAQGEKIGEVSAVEGEHVIISTGTFLGMGGRDVVLNRSELQMSGIGDEAKLQTSMTQEELERLPAYEGQAPTGGAEPPPGGYQPEQEGGVPPYPDGVPRQTTP